MNKIRFKDLSGWLKFAAIVSWIFGVYGILSFCIGFFAGILGK